jgi:hypothetical protein
MEVTSGNKPHKGISKRMKYCQTCNRVWEIQYQTRSFMYYDDFPTYGLKRVRCKECENNLVDENKV